MNDLDIIISVIKSRKCGFMEAYHRLELYKINNHLELAPFIKIKKDKKKLAITLN